MARISNHLEGLSGESDRRLERIFHEFDSSWKSGPRPRITDYLPSGPPEERHAALIELILIDLEYTIGRDPSARIEAYFVEFAELASDRALVLDLADREFQMRKARGDTPSIREFAARFPDLAARLILRLGDDGVTPRPEVFPDDKTPSYHNQSPGAGSHRSGLAAIDPTVPMVLPDDGPPRYRHIRPYARGGLGEVFVAEDSVLRRKVALKRIRPHLAGDEAIRGRFLREAEITARLEHPGVAPIYEVIVDRTGQLWYVVRFLKGQTLRAAIERYHRPKSSSEDQASRPLDFRRILTRFVSACETMSYAHNLGVVHRDLTPANIMLGESGETIVLDWGFATVTGDPDAGVVAVSVGPVASPLDASLLESGRLFGTPAFMSPEQAEMHQSQVGPHSDIYCLGAILYMVLTGRPPFKEADLAATLKKVRAGDFPRPREVSSVVPPALEAICLKAMRQEPKERYQDSKDLGQDIERWLADEPVFAYKPSLEERASRWARKNKRRLVLAACVAVIASGMGMTYGVITLKRRAATERAAVAKRDREERESRRKKEEAGTLARQKMDEARKLADGKIDDPAPLARAIELGEEATKLLSAADVDRKVIAEDEQRIDAWKALKRDREFLRDLDLARFKGALNREGRYDVQSKLDEYRRLFVNHGIDLKNLSSAAAGARIRESPLRERLVEILDDWAVELDRGDDRDTRSNLFAVARQADPDNPLAIKIRNAIEDRQPDALVGLVNEIKLDEATLTQIHTVGYALFKSGRLKDASEFLSTVLASDYWINTTLAQIHLGMARAADTDADRFTHRRIGVEHYRRALDGLRTSGWAYLNLADALLASGERVEARRVYVEARRHIDAGPTATGKHGALPFLYYKLGYLLYTDQKLDEAAEQFELALNVDPELIEAHNGLVDCRRRTGTIDRAIAYYETKLKASPDSAGLVAGRGLAFQYATGKRKAAEDDFRSAVKIKPGFAAGHYLLGNFLRDQGKLEESRDEQSTAVALGPYRELYHHGLGRSHFKLGKLDEAEKSLREAIRINPDFPEAQGDLGVCLMAMHRWKDAVAALRLGPVRLRSADTPVSSENRAQYLRVLKGLPRLLDHPSELADSDAAVVLAKLCADAGLHASAVGAWTAAFERDTPENQAAWSEHFRGDYYFAAKSAILAATGHSRDEHPPDDARRAEFQNLARSWLRLQRGTYEGVIQAHTNDAKRAGETLDVWRHDPDLSLVRDPSSREKLGAEESRAWTEFWAEVDTLIEMARGEGRSAKTID